MTFFIPLHCVISLVFSFSSLLSFSPLSSSTIHSFRNYASTIRFILLYLIFSLFPSYMSCPLALLILSNEDTDESNVEWDGFCSIREISLWIGRDTNAEQVEAVWRDGEREAGRSSKVGIDREFMTTRNEKKTEIKTDYCREEEKKINSCERRKEPLRKG